MDNTNERPITTLFLIESLDGKITTGDAGELDVDKDFKRIVGVMEGLPQYYAIEKQTDLHSLNTGLVMAKIGVNERTKEPTKIGASFIIIDSKPHLTENGVNYLAKWVNTLYLVTTNKNHPVFDVNKNHKNIVPLLYKDGINLKTLLSDLKSKYDVPSITLQSGGTLNSHWLREKLVDYVSIVIAPCLVGGKDTQSLIGGESLHTEEDLKKIKALKLIKASVLEHSYLHVLYKVVNETEIVNS